MNTSCELCVKDGGELLWRDAQWRVVRVVDAAFPAFYRLISQTHVAEFSELDAASRERCMALVVTIERVLREQLKPTKINLATLGNVVPHLHWHVIARFAWDSHFPQPVWGVAQRVVEGTAEQRLAVSLPVLDAAVLSALTQATA